MSKNKNGGQVVEESDDSKEDKQTTVIRISHKNYELLRRQAFYKRSTIRQIADDILAEELKDTMEKNSKQL